MVEFIIAVCRNCKSTVLLRDDLADIYDNWVVIEKHLACCDRPDIYTTPTTPCITADRITVDLDDDDYERVEDLKKDIKVDRFDYVLGGSCQ